MRLLRLLPRLGRRTAPFALLCHNLACHLTRRGPLAMSVNSSEFVIRGTYGLTISGASVCPMNTLAAIMVPISTPTWIKAPRPEKTWVSP